MSPRSSFQGNDTTDIIAAEGKLTYQPNASNRFEGYLSKQRYDKPNRDSFVNNVFTTQDSNSKELDTFVIEQLSYNRVLSDRIGVGEQAPGSYEKETRGEGSPQEMDTTIPCRVSDNKTRWRRAPGR